MARASDKLKKNNNKTKKLNKQTNKKNFLTRDDLRSSGQSVSSTDHFTKTVYYFRVVKNTKHFTVPFPAVFDVPQPIFGRGPFAEFWETQFVQGLFEKLSSCNIQVSGYYVALN